MDTRRERLNTSTASAAIIPGMLEQPGVGRADMPFSSMGFGSSDEPLQASVKLVEAVNGSLTPAIAPWSSAVC